MAADSKATLMGFRRTQPASAQLFKPDFSRFWCRKCFYRNRVRGKNLQRRFLRMMFWIAVIIAHAALITLLVIVGLGLNEFIRTSQNNYPGLIAVFSVGFGLYTTILNFLYHRNQAFHLLLNRIKFKLKRSHTYWQPHFKYELSKEISPEILENLWNIFSHGPFGEIRQRTRTDKTLVLVLDSLLVIRFHISEHHLFVDFEQKLLVPTHLYEAYEQKISRIAESIVQLTKPDQIDCAMIVTFGSEINPYYGFYISRVPPELLQDFRVSFRTTNQNSCRIEAGKEHVSLECSNLTEFFDAFRRVLNLKAVPS
jgi:hypothetical protein